MMQHTHEDATSLCIVVSTATTLSVITIFKVYTLNTYYHEVCPRRYRSRLGYRLCPFGFHAVEQSSGGVFEQSANGSRRRARLPLSSVLPLTLAAESPLSCVVLLVSLEEMSSDLLEVDSITADGKPTLLSPT